MNNGRFQWNFFLAAILVISFVSLTALAGDGVEAAKVFQKLKQLEGTWQGEARQISGAEEQGQEGVVHPVTHEFRVSAAGTVVMEIMGPGTEHEMINMFHLDGEDLVLTHYCAGGNQPSMRLDRAGSTEKALKFDFAGGTNLNADVDPHIHSSKIAFTDGGGLESVWTSYDKGKQAGVMQFSLERARH